jgi:hypothetical protein
MRFRIVEPIEKGSGIALVPISEGASDLAKTASTRQLTLFKFEDRGE